MSIKALLFDLDGLMIESEAYHFVAMQELLARYGKKPAQEWFKPMIGMDNDESARFIIGKTGLQMSAAEFSEERYEIMKKLMPKFTEPKDGLLDLLGEGLKRELRMGVASNSSRPYVEQVLDIMGIKDKFECIFTSDDVANVKPDPEMYLAAAAYLGVPAAQCMAFEDSPHGMQAALRAGMGCVVIPNKDLQVSDFEGATFMFKSLVELNNHLDQVLR